MNDVTALLRQYGPEIYGWMLSNLANGVEADDAFAAFAEDLWGSLVRHDGRCSLRTWCYMIARRHVARAIHQRSSRVFVGLSESSARRLAESQAERTPLYVRTDVKARVRELRSQLSADDQTILVLRVDKGLNWRDISLVMLGEHASDAVVTRHAAGLRKRFERIKVRLRELAVQPVQAG
jgi:RNA polymerase sigma-70 factor (ECF subfamily)